MIAFWGGGEWIFFLKKIKVVADDTKMNDNAHAPHARLSPGGSNDEVEQTLNQLLACMDGLDSNKSGVIVIAATNRYEVRI